MHDKYQKTLKKMEYRLEENLCLKSICGGEFVKGARVTAIVDKKGEGITECEGNLFYGKLDKNQRTFFYSDSLVCNDFRGRVLNLVNLFRHNREDGGNPLFVSNEEIEDFCTYFCKKLENQEDGSYPD